MYVQLNREWFWLLYRHGMGLFFVNGNVRIPCTNTVDIIILNLFDIIFSFLFPANMQWRVKILGGRMSQINMTWPCSIHCSSLSSSVFLRDSCTVTFVHLILAVFVGKHCEDIQRPVFFYIGHWSIGPDTESGVVGSEATSIKVLALRLKSIQTTKNIVWPLG